MTTVAVANIPVPAPSVSIIVPCFNEVRHIEALLRGIFSQTCLEPLRYVEVIVADGMSDDGTRAFLETYSLHRPELRVINNPERFVAAGLNRAIRAARGDIIIRMDVHTEYAPDYVWQCVRTLLETGADNVGGAWRAVGKSYVQAAIAAAFQSKFSSGGAASHLTTYQGPVDSVYLGCWRKETLERLGGFDEDLVRNQDDELDFRIVRAGGRIWQDQSIRSWYHARASLGSLFRQYSQYGYWKIRVMQKHHRPAAIRHVVPIAFATACVLLGIFAVFDANAFVAFIAVAGSYVIASLLASALTCSQSRQWKCFPVLPAIFLTIHLAYAYGSACGLVDFMIRKRSAAAFSKCTR